MSARARWPLPAAVAVLALIGACTPEPLEPVPITGTADVIAPSVPLSAEPGGAAAEVEGFFVDADLGGFAVLGSGHWSCYAPDDDHLDFDSEAFDDGLHWGVFLSVPAALWGTGTLALGQEGGAQLTVAGRSRFGVATSGFVTITQAGTTAGLAGQSCEWSATGVPLAGEKDPSDR